MAEEDGLGLDYILSLDDVPSKLPPHLELFRTRVLCNNDAPIHVNALNLSFILFKLFQFYPFYAICFFFFKNIFNTHFFVKFLSSQLGCWKCWELGLQVSHLLCILEGVCFLIYFFVFWCL